MRFDRHYNTISVRNESFIARGYRSLATLAIKMIGPPIESTKSRVRPHDESKVVSKTRHALSLIYTSILAYKNFDVK